MNYIDTDRVINLKRHLYRFASNTFTYLNLSMYLTELFYSERDFVNIDFTLYSTFILSCGNSFVNVSLFHVTPTM